MISLEQGHCSFICAKAKTNIRLHQEDLNVLYVFVLVAHVAVLPVISSSNKSTGAAQEGNVESLTSECGVFWEKVVSRSLT